MFRARRTRDGSLAAALSDISTDHMVFDIDHAWFVVGPSGLFVVCDDEGGPVNASRHAVERARDLRAKLADQLSWVPFVDALVVSEDSNIIDEGAIAGTECPVIPVDMLLVTLTEGPRSIDEDTLGKLTLLGLRRSY